MRIISLKSNDLEDKGPIRLEHGRTQASIIRLRLNQ